MRARLTILRPFLFTLSLFALAIFSTKILAVEIAPANPSAPRACPRYVEPMERIPRRGAWAPRADESATEGERLLHAQLATHLADHALGLLAQQYLTGLLILDSALLGDLERLALQKGRFLAAASCVSRATRVGVQRDFARFVAPSARELARLRAAISERRLALAVSVRAVAGKTAASSSRDENFVLGLFDDKLRAALEEGLTRAARICQDPVHAGRQATLSGVVARSFLEGAGRDAAWLFCAAHAERARDASADAALIAETQGLFRIGTIVEAAGFASLFTGASPLLLTAYEVSRRNAQLSRGLASSAD